MSFGTEDESKIKHEVLDGVEIGLLSLAFDESSVTDKLVFKSLKQGCTLLYCDDKLKKLCHDNHLRGVEFDLDLLDVFAH